jgi:hypothetical protein
MTFDLPVREEAILILLAQLDAVLPPHQFEEYKICVHDIVSSVCGRRDVDDKKWQETREIFDCMRSMVYAPNRELVMSVWIP